jgi:hypothetical protein
MNDEDNESLKERVENQALYIRKCRAAEKKLVRENEQITRSNKILEQRKEN